MGVPLRYNLRNLVRRKVRTTLTILGIALVIGAAVIMMAYSRGLLHSMRNNGDADNAIVLSRRATDREFSSFKSTQFDILTSLILDDVAWYSPTGDEGDSIDLVAPYISHSFELRLEGEKEEDPLRRGLVDGVDVERAAYMHDGFRIVDGRMLDLADENVAIVGSIAYARLGVTPEALGVGKKLIFKELEWEIVGVFEAEGSSADGAIWVPVEELQAHLNRVDFNYAVIKAKDEAGMKKIVDFVNRSEQMELRAVSELDYYRGYAETFRTFALIGAFMAFIITLGGVMVGMNTMYTAIAGRTREIGLLQVQGFSKASVLSSFLLESLVLAVLGGILGCALGSLVNGMPMQVTMGVFLFRVDALVIAVGMGLAVAIGLIGALVPARRAVRMRMVDAMRYA